VIIRKSAQEIAKMAAAGALVAETIAHLGEQLEPGITTGELDRMADELIGARGGIPTSKGYRGYPAAICISPNSMVVHGIPGAYEVRDGDLITIDVGVTLDGYIADSAYTFGVGEISETARKLLGVGQQALEKGIEQAQPGNRVGDISAAVQQQVEGAGFSVVRSLVGHGVVRRDADRLRVALVALRRRDPAVLADECAGSLVELVGRHARLELVAQVRDRLRHERARGGHLLDLLRGLPDDHAVSLSAGTCSRAAAISAKTSSTERAACSGTSLPVAR